MSASLSGVFNCSDGTAGVQSSLGLDVGRVSVLRGVKDAEAYALTVNADSTLKLSAAFDYACPNQSSATGNWRFSKILHVGMSGHIAQVANCVVRSVSINMVNLQIRPNAEHVEPRKSVRVVAEAVNADDNVANSLVDNAGALAFKPSAAKPYAPNKVPGLRVVVENVAQSLRRKIGLSHDAVLSLIGQRPARVSARGGLRYFIWSAT